MDYNNVKNRRVHRQNSLSFTVMQASKNLFSAPSRVQSHSERNVQHSLQQQPSQQRFQSLQQTEGLKQRLLVEPQHLQSLQHIQHQPLNPLIHQQQTQYVYQQTPQKQQQSNLPHVTLQIQHGSKMVQATTPAAVLPQAENLHYQLSNNSNTLARPNTQQLQHQLSNQTNASPGPNTQMLHHQSSNNSNESFTSQCSPPNGLIQIIPNNISPYLPMTTKQYSSQISNLQQNTLLEQNQQIIPKLKSLLPHIQPQQQTGPKYKTLTSYIVQEQHQHEPQLKQHIIMDSQVTLVPEICDIMRSFGDSDRPRADSVRLVEQILKQQLLGMFNEASMIAMDRKNNGCPSQADFEFLIRNNPVKIARMRKHLKDMRILKKFLSIRTGRPQDFAEELERHESDEELSLDVPELFDEERTRRLFRADRISQILNGQQYVDFNEARKTSFYCRHGEKIKNKFRSFLKLPADLRIPVTVMNILAYFAHETIAVIVDYAILTRLNTKNRRTEPYSRVTSAGASAAMLHVCPEVTQGRGLEVLKPITVQEIQEGMRRFRQMRTKHVGYGRRSSDYELKNSFLAL